MRSFTLALLEGDERAPRDRVLGSPAEPFGRAGEASGG